ncbi:hypothetical protein GCM10018966_000590 [Streptomyces yanii]
MLAEGATVVLVRAQPCDYNAPLVAMLRLSKPRARLSRKRWALMRCASGSAEVPPRRLREDAARRARTKQRVAQLMDNQTPAAPLTVRSVPVGRWLLDPAACVRQLHVVLGAGGKGGNASR